MNNTEALALIDALAEERVVIIGSLPPEARDVDVVARPADEAAIAKGLRAAGFVDRGAQWASFDDDVPVVVDLLPVASLRLSHDEQRQLFERAQPLGSHQLVCTPAPDHELLFLARRVQRSGECKQRWLDRARQVSEREDGAWRRATGAAAAWGVEEGLRNLRAGKVAPGRRTLVRSKGRYVRVRRAITISLSGLDGAGKSAQATGLERTLTALGLDVDVHWSRVGYAPILGTIAAAGSRASRIASRARRVRHRVGRSSAGAASAPAIASAATSAGPRRSARSVWVVVVALVDVVEHLRRAAASRARGRVLIHDRYVLDTVVGLHERYPGASSLRLATWLVRVLTPAPTCAFFLDVPAAETRRRKPGSASLALLEAREALYHDWLAPCGVTRLDGTQPRARVAAQIAAAVWRALPR